MYFKLVLYYCMTCLALIMSKILLVFCNSDVKMLYWILICSAIFTLWNGPEIKIKIEGFKIGRKPNVKLNNMNVNSMNKKDGDRNEKGK